MSPEHQAFNNHLRESKFERSCSTKHDICSSCWSMAKGNTQPQSQPCHAPEGVHNRCSHMVGIPFFPPPPSSKRCFCGQVLDSYGDHLLGCGEGNWRNRRHNALADVVFEALLSDNANCRREQRLCGDSNARPGDVYHPDFERGRPTYLTSQ